MIVKPAGTAATGIRRLTPTGSKTTHPATNGKGARACISWIERFVEHTDNLESPVIFRRWAAITTLAAVMEQKVWLTTSSPLYANLYVFLVGHPGTGKTRTIRAAKSYPQEIVDFHFAPTSLTAASLIDSLVESKRMLIRLPDEPLEYNTMLIAADELGTFMHQYDDEMVGVLSAFYDPDPYGHNRRGKEIKIKIKKPQLNILCGTTPSNLLKFVPEGAWEQGFTSRIIMVFSDERIVGDDFAVESRQINVDLLHDIKIINSIVGEFKVTEDYRTAVNDWRALQEPPTPNHPKLLHYNTRRRVHLYKLSMVSAIDRSDVLLLTKDDFNRAMGWLIEAEELMPDIFTAGASGSDGKTIDEIHHLIMIADLGSGVPERTVVKFISERVPSHSVMRMVDVMERAGKIKAVSHDPKTGQRLFKAFTNQ